MAKYQKQQGNKSAMGADNLYKKKGNSVKRSRKGMVNEGKNTMNFVRYESAFSLKKVLPVILVLVLAAALITKFGFMDPLAEKKAAYDYLAQKEEELAQVNLQLEGYDELSDKYARYSYGLMTDSEINLVDRMDILALMEMEIATKAIIDNLAVNNNVLTMNIYGITLEEASTIVNRLESDELVTHASVNSASAEDGKEARIFISITLAKVEKEAE